MTIDTEFLDLMPDTIQVNRYVSVDKFGKISYNPVAENIRARVVYKTRQAFNSDNVLVLSRAQVYLYGNNNITFNDKITLPDGKVRLLVNIDRYPDEDGIYYEQLLLA